MNEQQYAARLIKLEDFLRSNHKEEWKWAEIYDLLSLSPTDRPSFRRRLAREWAIGSVPWLCMKVQRGRGGIGGLRWNADQPPAGEGADNPVQALWKCAAGRGAVSSSVVKRLLEAAVSAGYVNGLSLEDMEA
jgi:hypothetical protein